MNHHQKDKVKLSPAAARQGCLKRHGLVGLTGENGEVQEVEETSMRGRGEWVSVLRDTRRG
jgi:hypothetical protein